VTNIGSGFEISIGDAAGLIAEMMGAEIQIVADSDRLRPANSEVERLLAATDKAAGMFGWKPEYAGCDGFRRGLQKTIHWFCDPVNRPVYDAAKYNI
jgi:dTDP-glucose 4,6-dehydratase